MRNGVSDMFILLEELPREMQIARGTHLHSEVVKVHVRLEILRVVEFVCGYTLTHVCTVAIHVFLEVVRKARRKAETAKRAVHGRHFFRRACDHG